MRNCTAFIPLLMSLFFNIKCSPVSQPGYEGAQYVATQNVPTLTYKPQQLHFKPAVPSPVRPVYEGKPAGLQFYASQQQQQLQQQPQQQQQQKSPPSIQTPGYGPVRQVFVATNQGPRQVDPHFYDQVVKAQQQTAIRSQPQQITYQPQPQLQQQVKYVPQPQQVKYVSQQQQQQQPYSARYQQPQQKPRKGDDEEEESEGDYDPNPSYQFGFDVNDDQYTNYQTRKEERDGKKITGSYSVVDADGYIRTVKYTADPKEGFKAEVSREPTDIKIKIPKPDPQYQHLPTRQQQQQARSHQPEYIQVGNQKVAQRGQEEDENVVYQYQ